MIRRSDLRDGIGRVEVGEDRIRDELSLPVRDLHRREPVRIAIDGIEEINTEAALLLEAAKVRRILGVGEDLGLPVRVDAGGIGRAGAGGLGARSAAWIVRVDAALLPRSRQVERRAVHVLELVREEELPVLPRRAVVLVGEHDDSEHGVRAKELGPLGEQHLVDARRLRQAVHDRNGVVRLRVDKKAVKALELRLEAAPDLPDAEDEVFQFLSMFPGVGVARGHLVRERIPREEAFAGVRIDGARAAGVGAREEAALIVV
jgi:hypothetical protein